SMAGIEVEEDDPVALTDLPATAGPVEVGPDARVYVGVDAGTLGAIRDRGRRGPGGAILRLNPEGTVPADNPRGPRDPVWASGLGRAADLAFDADGRVWVADPVARWIVRLGPGEDAGWPVIRGRLDEPLERLAAREIGPLFRSAAWVPDRGAPTAVARLRSPAWGATLAVGLDDGRVVRIRPEGTVRAGAVAGPLDGPVVDLAEGPDGRLWALTPSTLWRIDPPGIAPFERGRGAVADTVAPAPRPY
ncbi:MAG: PQQ-dependent sugar dehydrogenase, partial [Gemmatimonadota bacterium]|nr:PQQ-dependent sugar dehydrogenase [Gemmatimonadota bacterium]